MSGFRLSVAVRMLYAGAPKIDIALSCLMALLLVAVTPTHAYAPREVLYLASALGTFFFFSYRLKSNLLGDIAATVERPGRSSRLELGPIDFAWRTFVCLMLVPLTFVVVAWVGPIVLRGAAPSSSPAEFGVSPYWMVVTMLTVEAVLLCGRVHSGWKRIAYPIADSPVATGFVWLCRYGLTLWLALRAVGSASPTFAGLTRRDLEALGALHLFFMVMAFVAAFSVLQFDRWLAARRDAIAGTAAAMKTVRPASASTEFAWLVLYILLLLVLSEVIVGTWADGPLMRWLRAEDISSASEVLQRASLGWHLAVGPIIASTPVLAMARWDLRGGTVFSARESVLGSSHIDLARGWLLCQAVVQRSLPFYLISLPLTTVVSYQANDQRLGLFLTGTAAWLGPLLRDLYFLDETLHWAYQFGLRRVIERLNRHVLILGFGDLARRFVRTSLEVDVFSYCSLQHDLNGSANVLLPTGRLAKVITSLAAVEINEQHVAGTSRAGGTLPVGWADVSWIVQDLARTAAHPGEELGPDTSDRPPQADVDYVIPVVVGDAVNREVQSAARLERAAFVVCLISEADATEPSQSVLNRLDQLARAGLRIPAAIAVHSSTYVPYVTERRLRQSLPIHYIFPEHLEGLNAAVLAYAAYVSLYQQRPGTRPRILLCGSGKRMFYLVDSFLKSFSAAELNDYTEAQLAGELPHIALLSNDQSFSRMVKATGGSPPSGRGATSSSAPDLPPEARATSTPHVSRVTLDQFARWDSATLRRTLDVRVLQFLRYITRHSPTSAAIPDPVGGGLPIPVVDGDASDRDTIYTVLRELRPDIIVVSEKHAEDELKAINSIATNVTRLLAETVDGRRGLDRPPHLLISGDTGKLHVASYFDRALRYYSTLWQRASPSTDRIRFPSPYMPPPRLFSSYGDSMVDVLDDPAERLVGIVRTYLHPRPGAPVELNFCGSDSPTTMASSLAAMGGYEPVGTAANGCPRLSFANTRLIARPGGRFIVKGYAYLDAGAGSHRPGIGPPDFARLGIVAGHEPRQHLSPAAVLFAGQPGEPQPAEVVGHVRDLFNFSARACSDSHLKDQLKHCCGMPSCPLEAFNKVSAGVYGLPVSDDAREQAARQRSSDRLRSRFTVGTYDHGEQHDPDDRAFAHFRLWCSDEGLAGSFAVALSALLCTALAPVKRSEYVFNLTYISSYECHDERHGVFTCYGRRTKRGLPPHHKDGHVGLRASQVIERAEIFPIRNSRDGSSPWEAYADDVAKFLTSQAPQGEPPFVATPSTSPVLAESIVIGRKTVRSA